MEAKDIAVKQAEIELDDAEDELKKAAQHHACLHATPHPAAHRDPPAHPEALLYAGAHGHARPYRHPGAHSAPG